MWQQYYIPASIAEVLQLLGEHAGRSRVVAGGTDLLIEVDRGLRRPQALIDITRIPELGGIVVSDDGRVELGALTTHNQVVASALCVERALPLAQACVEVGAPQIRNRATVAGNLVTGSPANDTITPLMALDATVVLRSVRGAREVRLRDFYTGVRRTVMAPDELLSAIRFRPLNPSDKGMFLKLGLRRAQAISVINLAVVLRMDGDTIADARIALGSVAPTIVHAAKAETFLVGRTLDEAVITEAAALAEQAARPISDIRGTASYRSGMVAGLVARALRALAAGEERSGWQDRPVLLGPVQEGLDALSAPAAPLVDTIQTTINGAPAALAGAQDMSLLDALRDVAGLTGSKKGCAEGECGSCTVWLNGAAIMACLTPAAQAHGARVETIEGLARDGTLHPVQQAFVERGAVQCGYCTPGLLMAAAKLLEERPHPSSSEAQQAIAGNLCRCTGYAKIIEAITEASA